MSSSTLTSRSKLTSSRFRPHIKIFRLDFRVEGDQSQADFPRGMIRESAIK